MTRAALIILDGWGEAPDTERNAVRDADTPNIDRYRENGRVGFLRTHGETVGLIDGQMGNSEVGHLNIGAGRIVDQDIKRIHKAIEESSFNDNQVIQESLSKGEHLHLIGLLSDGGVHSSQHHLNNLIELAKQKDKETYLHCFLDGRDTPPKSAEKYLEKLQHHIADMNGGVSSISGRYYAMDRDERWSRTKKAYDSMVKQEGHVAETPIEAVRNGYERGESDEFIEPTVIQGGEPIRNGDSVFFINFRADRARQLTRMLNGIRNEWGEDTELDIHFASMTKYDDYGLPYAFERNQPQNVLGEVLSNEDLTQLRIAETEKYAHVTYFLNGGREEVFPGEERVIVPSPDVETYDETPEMSAYEVTEKAIQAVGDHDVIILNYANPDMVGHTGDLEAAIQACEAVDECTGMLVEELRGIDADVIITADHGNADDMGSIEDPHTAHTFNDVPFIVVDGEGEIDGVGELRDISPTLLSLLGVDIPGEMTGDVLV